MRAIIQTLAAAQKGSARGASTPLGSPPRSEDSRHQQIARDGLQQSADGGTDHQAMLTIFTRQEPARKQRDDRSQYHDCGQCLGSFVAGCQSECPQKHDLKERKRRRSQHEARIDVIAGRQQAVLDALQPEDRHVDKQNQSERDEHGPVDQPA